MSGAAVMPGLSWRHHLLVLRDRAVASPRFRRWATAFPLTRPIARRRAKALFDLCAGFVYSQVLLACVQLDVLEILAERPATASALAARLHMTVEAATRLLDAATALRLTSRRNGRYSLGPLGAPVIGNEAVRQMVLHHPILYADLQDPVALLRADRGQTALAGYWPYAAGVGDSQVGPYTALMAASQPMVADEILAAYRIGRHRHVMDVGGGDGSFLAAVAARVPTLRLTLFDLPAVAAQARARFAASGAQAQCIGGSFLTDPLPTGADLITLVRVVHDHDDAEALTVLRAVRAALPPGGTLLLAEPMAQTPGAEPVGDAYFGFYLLAMGRGRPRSADSLVTLLHQAGFDRARRLPTRTPLLTSIVVANVN